MIFFKDIQGKHNCSNKTHKNAQSHHFPFKHFPISSGAMKVTLAGVTAITTDLQVDIGISASTKLVPCVHLHTVVVDWKEEERHK